MIRPATVADADAISAVQRRTWVHAYADILDVEDLSPAIGDPARWREALAEQGMPTWVWDQDGRIAGFAAAGRTRDGDAGAEVGEVYAIYVDPPAQGAGVGSALLDHAVGWLRDAGFRTAVLWTFEGAHTAPSNFFGKDATFAIGGAIPFGLHSRQMSAWTFEGNGAARDFYEHHGWRLVERDPQHADRWAPEVRYRREL